MSNLLFNALGNTTHESDPMNMIEQIKKFRQDMQGKNPNVEINKLLLSGKVNQQQLNQAQQMAHQIQIMFKGLK